MQKSDSVGQIGAALAKAQRTMDSARKDSTNPFFKSKYADLSSIWDACKEHLTQNGISVSQFPGLIQGDDGKPVIVDVPEQFKDDPCKRMMVRVETLLLHESGEWLLDDLVVPVAFFDAQGAGSAITYARRYALAAIAGVTPDEDDDGNNASGNRGQDQGNWKTGTQKKATAQKSATSETSNATAPSQIDAFKTVLWKQYGCKNPEDCKILLKAATGLDHVNLDYLLANPDLISDTKGELETFCKANSINPSEALAAAKSAPQSA